MTGIKLQQVLYHIFYELLIPRYIYCFDPVKSVHYKSTVLAPSTEQLALDPIKITCLSLELDCHFGPE